MSKPEHPDAEPTPEPPAPVEALRLSELLWAITPAVIVGAGFIGILGLSGVIKGSEADQTIFLAMAAPLLIVIALTVAFGALLLIVVVFPALRGGLGSSSRSCSL